MINFKNILILKLFILIPLCFYLFMKSVFRSECYAFQKKGLAYSPFKHSQSISKHSRALEYIYLTLLWYVEEK